MTDPTSNERLTPEKLAEYRDLLPMGRFVGVGGDALRLLLDEIEACWAERKPVETTAPNEFVEEISRRHERVSRLLQIAPGTILGPMDADAAHDDRGKLLTFLSLSVEPEAPLSAAAHARAVDKLKPWDVTQPEKATASLTACECLVRDKAPSAYHNVKCPRYVADLL